MKVAGGPTNQGLIGRIRITEGKYVDGDNFKIVDDWTTTPSPHARMSKLWTGSTIFHDKAECYNEPTLLSQ